jgi:hypothetical protein
MCSVEEVVPALRGRTVTPQMALVPPESRLQSVLVTVVV